MARWDEKFKGERMRKYIHWLRDEESERYLSWVKYANTLTVQPEKQKSQLLVVEKASDSRQDSASHSSMKAPQSDRQPWNYKSYTPQQQARIDGANVEYKRKQKERDEKE